MRIKVVKKIDVGLLMLEASPEDKKALERIIKTNGFPEPQVKMAVYKNRRGRYKDILLWCQADRGVCRINPIFATTYQYELIPIEDLQVTVED